MRVVERLLGPEVGGLDADDHILVSEGGLGRSGWDQVDDGLLGIAHSRGGDVDVGEDSAGRLVDDGLSEVIDFLAAGRARIHAGGDALLEEVGVGVEAAAVVAVQLSAGVVGVDVDVEQSRGDVEAGDIHRVGGVVGRDVGFDAGDFPIADPQVARAVYVPSRVDQVSAFEEEIEGLLIGSHGPAFSRELGRRSAVGGRRRR